MRIGLLVVSLCAVFWSSVVSAESVRPKEYVVQDSYTDIARGSTPQQACAKNISQLQRDAIVNYAAAPDSVFYVVTGDYFGPECYSFGNGDLWSIAPVKGICPDSHPYYDGSGGTDLCYDNEAYEGPFVGDPYEETITSKELGCSANLVGNPCNAATGNKYQEEVDYTGAGIMPLRLVRYYNSYADDNGLFGIKWRSNFDRRLVFSADSVVVYRANGRQYAFKLVNGIWTSDPDVHDTLTREGEIWRYLTSDDLSEIYDGVDASFQSVHVRGTRRPWSMTHRVVSSPYRIRPDAPCLLPMTTPVELFQSRCQARRC